MVPSFLELCMKQVESRGPFILAARNGCEVENKINCCTWIEIVNGSLPDAGHRGHHDLNIIHRQK